MKTPDTYSPPQDPNLKNVNIDTSRGRAWRPEDEKCVVYPKPTVEEHVQKITHTMPRDLARRIDDYWHAQRLPSRSEAIRRLIQIGLDVEHVIAETRK